MKKIDFLPEEYRLKRLRRQGLGWELAVLALFGGTSACAFAWQQWTVARTNFDLTRIEANYREVSERIARAEATRKALGEERQFADLFALRNHSWPRTAMLAAVAGKLPEEMTLLELQLTQESQINNGLDASTPPANESDLKKSPAEVDALRLRAEAERTPVVLFLVGRTPEPESVYRFVRELGGTPMFQAVQLESLVGQKSDVDHTVQSDFRIRIQLRPGYGLKGAPAPPSENGAIAANEEKS